MSFGQTPIFTNWEALAIKKRTVVTEKPLNWGLNKCHPLDNYYLQIVEHLIHEQKLLHVFH